jgi:hypothetical protein
MFILINNLNLNKMQRNQNVKITDIKPVANGAFQLTLEQEYKRDGASNVVGFFMEGHPGVTPSNGKLITWQTVSAQKMSEYNFTVGQNLNEVLGFETNIQVNEGFIPRKWKDSEGNEVTQEAKRAGKDGELLTKEGKPIYRNTSVVFGPAKDTLVEHDTVVTRTVVTTGASLLNA